MRRDIVWERLDRPGLEHLTLEIGTDAIRAESLVLLQLDSGLVRLRYRLQTDGGWRTRTASFHLDQGAASRSLELTRDGDGWTVDGEPRADLAGCPDIDIAATPLTNTMPIYQLGLAAGEARTFRALYVRVPELTVAAMEQTYTRLDPATPPRRFRYASPGFTAEVAVDADGLVEDYPPGWKRRMP
jgi:uncharacterized protein